MNDPGKEHEYLVKKMITDPAGLSDIKTSYDVFKKFADDFKQEIDAANKRNEELSARLWNGN